MINLTIIKNDNLFSTFKLRATFIIMQPVIVFKRWHKQFIFYRFNFYAGSRYLLYSVLELISLIIIMIDFNFLLLRT